MAPQVIPPPASGYPYQKGHKGPGLPQVIPPGLPQVIPPANEQLIPPAIFASFLHNVCIIFA